MTKIGQIWKNMSIPERAAIARTALNEGKRGSASWNSLSEEERSTLTLFLDPDAEMTPLASEILEPAPGAIEKFIEATKVQDYLLWVGWASYPTIAGFVEEAKTMGVSRRISKIPIGLEMGKSRIFLAHDEGETDDAVIFGFFVPTTLEMITLSSSSEQENGIDPKLRGIVDPISVETASHEEIRGCGMREDVGALYAVSYTSEDTMMARFESHSTIPETTLSGPLVAFDQPKDYNTIIHRGIGRLRFRGIKKVDGEDIIHGITKTVPSSRHRVKKADRIKVKEGSAWSDEERAIFKDLLSQMPSRRAFREMHKINGRSIAGMDFQLTKIRREGKNEDAD